MGTVLFITTDNFPYGNAGATRQEHLAKLFTLCGYAVTIIGLGDYTGFSFRRFAENISYISMRGHNKHFFFRVSDRLFFHRRIIHFLKKNGAQYDVILAASLPINTFLSIKKYCRKNGIVFIHDSVEWYSPSEFKFGSLSWLYIEKDIINRKLVDESIRIIGISNYLTDYFNDKGCIAVRIPFVYDTEKLDEQKKEKKDDSIVFIYAGQAGRKDLLNPFFLAVSNLPDRDIKRIRINIFGMTTDELLENGHIDSKTIMRIGNSLIAYGRVSRSTVEKYLRDADFGILFRRSQERYAKAGFPTKVVENMSHGVPMFCNISSDLNLYLIDNKNSIISNSENVADIEASLYRILKMSKAEILELGYQAKATSEKCFDYRLYKNELESLLKG